MAAYTAIDDPEAFFQAVIYTGNGAANNAITLPADTDMQPDLVWIKNRDATDSHCVFDSARGATKVIHADTTGAEATDADTLDSFTSDGFQVDADVKVNTDSEKYVAWCWKESADAGFDIVAYTGDGSDRTISHSLSAVPKMIIVKNRTGTNRDWMVYHVSNGATKFIYLNEANALGDAATYWQDTDPTTSVFSIGTNANVNEDTKTVIAYVFTDKQGFSKFGTYEGNGNANGTFVYTGFRPAFVITKSVDSTSAWEIFDDKREGYNVDNDALTSNGTTVEATADQIDILSNGFKCRIATDPNVAETYIYMAFAKAPFVNSNGVPCNAR